MKDKPVNIGFFTFKQANKEILYESKGLQHFHFKFISLKRYKTPAEQRDFPVCYILATCMQKITEKLQSSQYLALEAKIELYILALHWFSFWIDFNNGKLWISKEHMLRT